MWEKAGSVNFSMKEVLIVRNQYNDLLCKLIDQYDRDLLHEMFRAVSMFKPFPASVTFLYQSSISEFVT